MAAKGITLAETSIDVCNKLFDMNSSTAELQSLVDVMHLLVEDGRKTGGEVGHKLEDIRNSLMRVSLCVLPPI